MAIIGIMQGRLGPPTEGRFQSFPRETWAEEFGRARAAGLDRIEWIYDTYGADVNPLAADPGIERMRTLSAEHGVAVGSLCADYFLDRPLLRTDEAERVELLRILAWLFGRCEAAGIEHMVMPFVDASRIETDAEGDEVVALLGPALEWAGGAGVELHLETSLPPARFAALLDRLPHPMLKANYDSGNSASLGYSPRQEFAAYGPRVGSIHIKDRIRGGGTVPLGTGDADFPALFEAIRRVGYPGAYILQVARGEPGDEVGWSARNREWLAGQLAAAGPAETEGEGES
jgi:L-ribulose-5-phosphate 3-epimerase